LDDTLTPRFAVLVVVVMVVVVVIVMDVLDLLCPHMHACTHTQARIRENAVREIVSTEKTYVCISHHHTRFLLS
jgi:hypothetical protein